jgi:oligopeptide/dipeptide ABC transporter ATP-binding protein
VAESSPHLLDVCDLRVCFRRGGRYVPVVDGVSFVVDDGRTTALVGETGCGKTVTALAIMRLIPEPPGQVNGSAVLCDRQSEQCLDIMARASATVPGIRGGRIAMIFQEPRQALNPVRSIGRQIAETVSLHRGISGRAARAVAVDLLKRVGIADPHLRAAGYAHQLSGGMCQRVMIAMALAGEPSLLIADEPTTALDVGIQAQILDLLADVQRETGTGLLLITHDLDVMARMADRVAVMYAGRVVEWAAADELLSEPLHPYTQSLLRCRRSGGPRPARYPVIPGAVPRPEAYPGGCRFHPRCEMSARLAASSGRPSAECGSGDHRIRVLVSCVQGANGGAGPPLVELRPGHAVACWECEPEHRPEETIGSA